MFLASSSLKLNNVTRWNKFTSPLKLSTSMESCSTKMNIVEPIFVQCRNKPAEVALCAPGTEFNVVSYARLARCVNNLCRQFIAADITPRSRVAVFIDDPILHVLTLIALMRLGIVTISGKSRNFSWTFDVQAFLTDKPFVHPVGKVMVIDASWTTGDDAPIALEYIHRGSFEEVCRIMLTSGTTGQDKAVAVTNRMMMDRIERQKIFFGARAAFCARTFIEFSLATSLGFQLLIATLWRGGAAFLTGDPQQTLRAFPIYKVQNVAGSPAGLLELVQAIERRPEYQTGFEAVFSGGSILTRSLSERVRARICSNLTKGYGSTEMGEVASMPSHFAPDISGAVGYLLPGIKVQVVDESDTPLPPSKEGIIRIDSETGVKEYLGDPEETARVFRNGWFYPGDIGYLTSENLLVISGRTKTVLNVGGEKVNPEKVEEVLSAHPSVQQVAVLSVPGEGGIDELCALIVPRSALITGALQTFCRDRLPPRFVPSRFIAVSELPLNEMGKIQRSKLSDLLKSN